MTSEERWSNRLWQQPVSQTPLSVLAGRMNEAAMVAETESVCLGSTACTATHQANMAAAAAATWWQSDHMDLFLHGKDDASSLLE